MIRPPAGPVSNRTDTGSLYVTEMLLNTSFAYTVSVNGDRAMTVVGVTKAASRFGAGAGFTICVSTAESLPL